MSTPKTTRHNIPADVTSFVGRNRELREIRVLLPQTRLLTLTGIGGVGKSRLARSAGSAARRAFPDGVWLIDFSSVQDPRFVRQAIQDCVPGPSTVLSLADHLRDKNTLLVLDNCDRLGQEVGDTVAALLAQCPDVRILATSRTPLGISAENVYVVYPFAAGAEGGTGRDAADDAVHLFRDRARSAGADLEAVTDTDVGRLCRRLDGVALAIELAALRTRTMTVQDIESRLGDRFELLKGGPRDLHPRHRSLWALLEWTWDQCDADERSLWAQFSVFAGPASLDAIRHVCRLDGESIVDDVVEGLVQQSILVGRRSGDTIRFQMLDTIREFGRLKLEREAAALGPGLTAQGLRERHLDHYATVAAAAEQDWFGPHQPRSMALINGEMPNLRAAFEWAIDDRDRCGTGVAMVTDLWFYWLGCGHLQEGRLWSEHAWDRVHEFGIPQEARSLWTLGWNLLITGDVDRAERHLRECLDEASRQGDAHAASFGRALLGAVHFFRDDVAGGVELYTAAIDEATHAGDQLARAMFLYQLGEAYCINREFDLAEQCCRECIAICERHGDRWCISYAQWVRALSAYQRGSYDSSAAIAAAALRTMVTVDDQLGIALVGELLAWIATRDGRWLDAATLLGATGSYWTASGGTVMGLRQLVTLRQECTATLRAQLSDRDFERATTAGAALGFERIATLALAETTGTGHRPAAPTARPVARAPAAAMPDLTPRELEIARLVASGLTNKEIAAKLVIGKRTVDTHVAHVLAKWGIRRRSEIASLVATRADVS
ncbi:ATP-binding protein [Rhodococcus olei]|uniref:ATP-binding protein n=1 Tax=Rhodococcus olei TaxID=2161675 RepID=UPI0031E50589